MSAIHSIWAWGQLPPAETTLIVLTNHWRWTSWSSSPAWTLLVWCTATARSSCKLVIAKLQKYVVEIVTWCPATVESRDVKIYNICLTIYVLWFLFVGKLLVGVFIFPRCFAASWGFVILYSRIGCYITENISQSEFSGGHSSTRQIQSEISLWPLSNMSLFSPKMGKRTEKMKDVFSWGWICILIFLVWQKCEHWVIISHYIVQTATLLQV